jgi:hypothetical protein
MKKIFLIGSCRIHRPFNCDDKHADGKYKLYNCLNTNWNQPNYLGSLYCSNYIIQTLRCLINKDVKNKTNIEIKWPQVELDDSQFLKLCETLYLADIIIIEIATIKCIINDGRYVSHDHNNKLRQNDTLTEELLINNIKIIEKLIADIGKKVLFVSHFNFNNISNRTLIINCLKQTAKHFFDPSSLIDNVNKLKDINHYTFDTEKIIMDNIHDYLSIM